MGSSWKSGVKKRFCVENGGGGSGNPGPRRDIWRVNAGVSRSGGRLRGEGGGGVVLHANPLAIGQPTSLHGDSPRRLARWYFDLTLGYGFAKACLQAVGGPRS